MAVFRVEKTKDYTVMANHHLKNKRLSLKAKGLLSMILSLPDDWNYTTRGLASICKDGVDSLGTALKELEIAGYILRNRLRDDKGRITDTEYVIYETPIQGKPDTATPKMESPDTEQPHTENPYMDNPDMDEPYTENPAQLNTNRSNTYPKNKNLKNTEVSNPYQSIPYPSNPYPSRSNTDAASTRDMVRANISYHCLVDTFNNGRLDEIVEIMVETLCGTAPVISVAGEDYPASLVKDRLLSLNSLHIEYVFECMENNPSDIRNIKKYLLTTLFNAPATMSSYYDAKVRHDLSKPRYDWADLIDG